jgi:putative membrane protein
MGMGAADVVPGVSGGTIAFITGIYEELINSIKSIDLEAVRLFFTGRWKAFWNKINGNFLLAVFAGIFISVLSLARLLEYLLEHQPIMIWSFFFGLVLASSYVVSRKISTWEYVKLVALVGGIGIAFYITSVTPTTTTDATWYATGPAPWDHRDTRSSCLAKRWQFVGTACCYRDSRRQAVGFGWMRSVYREGRKSG